jgi:hypothetical protein
MSAALFAIRAVAICLKLAAETSSGHAVYQRIGKVPRVPRNWLSPSAPLDGPPGPSAHATWRRRALRAAERPATRLPGTGGCPTSGSVALPARESAPGERSGYPAACKPRLGTCRRHCSSSFETRCPRTRRGRLVYRRADRASGPAPARGRGRWPTEMAGLGLSGDRSNYAAVNPQRGAGGRRGLR